MNKGIFANNFGLVKNKEQGWAVKMPPEHALCQYVSTGCISNTFYASGQDQLSKILDLCRQTSPEMVAKIAVYAREKGFMKDTPALLTAYLAGIKEYALLKKVFPRVIDNGKMLRNFVQVIRSGVVGRKSLGTLPKRLIATWFDVRTASEIFSQSIGNDPSFRDVIRLAHPKPLDKSKNALYQWLLGKDSQHNDLPPVLQLYEDYKAGKTKDVPQVPFEMLSNLNMGQAEWCQLAFRSSWQWLRMNLNNMMSHQVFDVPEALEAVANKLRNKDVIAKAKVFPYQILAAYKNTGPIPLQIRQALHEALEVSTEMIPSFGGTGCIGIDVSGSMGWAITGKRAGAHVSSVRCVDVASLMASCILRKNGNVKLMPFSNQVKDCSAEAMASMGVLEAADHLASLIGGGTACSAPVALMNSTGAKADWILIISDNESWVDSLGISRLGKTSRGKTPLQTEWEKFKVNNPKAKMVCLDIQPGETSQIQDDPDILNVGGFSDSVFETISLFLRGELTASHWVDTISKIDLEGDDK